MAHRAKTALEVTLNTEDTLLEFSITPIGRNESDSIGPTVARVAKRVNNSPLPNEIHAMGTVVEGQLDDCLELVRDCVREALKDNARVTASVRLDIRPGHTGRLEGSVRSVEEKIAR